LQQFEFLIQIGKQLGCRLWPHNRSWVFVKGDNNALATQLQCFLSYLANHSLMSTMHTVIRADRYHRTLRVIARLIIADYLHGFLRYRFG
jgi:isopenicillin N synthase-like dioxygenase